MTLLRKLCNQKSLTLFNQVRSLLFLRHNDNFHNSTFHSKGQLNSTLFTKKSELENVNEATEELENLSNKEVIDDDYDMFNYGILPDKDDNHTSNMNRNIHWSR